MILTADEVVQVATVLLPGFIALKVLYTFGFQSKRTDLEWAVWSLLGSLALAPVTSGLARQLGISNPTSVADKIKECVAPIVAGSQDAAKKTEGIVACATSALSAEFRLPLYVAIAAVVGVALGLALVFMWRLLLRLWPNLGSTAARSTWDKYTAQDVAPYIEVTLDDDRRLSGLLTESASTVEVDEPDLYVTEPAWYDEDKGDWVALEEAVGVWLPYGQIKDIVFMKPASETP